MKNFEIDKFLDELQHPQRKEIDDLREMILATDPEIKEIIKWNAPSYVYNGEDRITFNFPPKKDRFILVFHEGAKVRTKSTAKDIRDDVSLLEWKSDDRAILTFSKREDLEDNRAAIEIILKEWIEKS